MFRYNSVHVMLLCGEIMFSYYFFLDLYYLCNNNLRHNRQSLWFLCFRQFDINLLYFFIYNCNYLNAYHVG